MELTITDEQHQQVLDAVTLHKERLKESHYAEKFIIATAEATGTEPVFVEKIVKRVLAQREPGVPLHRQLRRLFFRQHKPLYIVSISLFVLVAGYFFYQPLWNNLAQQAEHETANTFLAEHYQANQIAHAYSQLAVVKLMVSTYFLENDQFPDDLQELGFDVSQLPNDPVIHDIYLDDNGEIRVQFEKSIGTSLEGTNLVMFLTPVLKDSWNGVQFDWQCSTTIKNIQVNYCLHNGMLVYKG
ncbi:hypothetical protein [Corallincola spongiicola]|uniref:Uncharacterized protein n=1 Tax=Corallincola spongiicola TaxID=2520508 RepID=A0ABY1WST2_9GAMM|nr:hypothetical protein [Corallincola spongiicola]TAA47794.1 hypothetical protein EXY25_00650 [Corallincola spongiicola]